MTEIKETLAILKARWPEVIVIVGLSFLARFLPVLPVYLVAKRFLTPRMFYLLYALICILFVVVLTTLRCGFLRTVYLEGQKRHSPLVLLQVGIHFLWRMIVLGGLYSLPFLMLIFLNRYVIVKLVTPASLSHTSFWIDRLFYIIVNIVFVKLILFIPALVIVLDCKTFESFKFLKFYKLSDAKKLVILYCVIIAIDLFASILSLYCSGISSGSTYFVATAITQYILRIIYSVAINFVYLMMAVMAVRFVGSLDLAYDNSAKDLNLEGLLKPPTED